MSGRMPTPFQVSLLQLLFQNLPIPNVGNAAGLQPSEVPGSYYLGLHHADPTASGNQSDKEATYPGYTRQAVPRSSVGWSVSASPSSAQNAAAITFPVCVDGSESLPWFTIGLQASGPTAIMFEGPLSTPLTVSKGSTPSFPIDACSVMIGA